MTTDTPTPPEQPWLAALARNRAAFAYVLLGLAVALGALSVWLGFKLGGNLWPVWAWTGFLTATFLGGGLWLLLSQPGEGDAADTLRVFVLTVGGLTGLATTAMCALLTINPLVDSANWWWNDILLWVKTGGPDYSVAADKRTEAGWHVILLMVTLLAGLVVMLASFQLGQADIRTHPGMRRLLYGYNAVLTGFLLVVILAVANIFVGTKFYRPLDFTSSTLYTISPKAQNILTHLERPVTVYRLLDRDDMPEGLFDAVESMLDSCQETGDKFKWERVSRFDKAKVDEITAKYPAAEVGLLVEYDGAGGKEYRMIPQDDLGRREFDRSDDNPDGKGRVRFTGEDALMTAIISLEDPKKPVIYFTEGLGELDLNGSDEEFIIDTRLRQRIPNVISGGKLRNRLEKRNFEVRTFDPARLGQSTEGKSDAEKNKLLAEKNEVIANADVIVVAGPRKVMPPDAVRFLTEYMARKGTTVGAADDADGKTLYGAPGATAKDSKGQTVVLKPRRLEKDGKMLVMLSLARETEGGEVPEAGLEGFLARYQVELPRKYLLNVPLQRGMDPMMVLAEVKPGAEQNNFLAATFKGRTLFTYRPRPVAVMPSPPGGMSSVQSDVILVSSSGQDLVAETNLSPALQQLFELLARNPALREKRAAEARNTPLAVAVTEGGGSSIPGHPPTGPKTPRLLVVGSSAMVSNYLVDQGGASVNFDFFASSLSWLIEKERTGGIEPKKIASFTLPQTAGTHYWSFVLLPALVICLGIVGTGTGVWLVRRR